jgi:hypothetical protein
MEHRAAAKSVAKEELRVHERDIGRRPKEVAAGESVSHHHESDAMRRVKRTAVEHPAKPFPDWLTRTPSPDPFYLIESVS